MTGQNGWSKRSYGGSDGASPLGVVKLALQRILRCSSTDTNCCRCTNAFGRSSPSLRLRPSSRDTWYALLILRMTPLRRRRVAWGERSRSGKRLQQIWREHKCHSTLNLQHPSLSPDPLDSRLPDLLLAFPIRFSLYRSASHPHERSSIDSTFDILDMRRRFGYRSPSS